jgi:hypothetical protein
MSATAPLSEEKAQNLPEKKAELLPKLLPKLQQEIVLIEGEAEEVGMTRPKDEHDDPAILNGFRAGKKKSSRASR